MIETIKFLEFYPCDSLETFGNRKDKWQQNKPMNAETTWLQVELPQ